MLISLNLLEGRYFRFLQYFSASVEVLRVSHSFSLPLPLSVSFILISLTGQVILLFLQLWPSLTTLISKWASDQDIVEVGGSQLRNTATTTGGWDCVCCGLSVVGALFWSDYQFSIVQTGLKLLVSPGFWCSSRLPSSSSNNFLCSNLSTLFCVLTIRSQSIT